MSKFKSIRLTGDYVAPSGINVGLQALMGEHQKEISINDEAKRKKGLDYILLDCITSIGSNSDLTPVHINSLLEGDRKAILFELRMISNKRNPLFIFDYEFPVRNRKRRTQRVEVNFTTETFPMRPYKWVYDKMVADWRVSNSIPDKEELTEEQLHEVFYEKKEDKDGVMETVAREFPVMYQSYQAITADHLKQVTKLEDCGVDVHWELLTVAASSALNIKPHQVTSHTHLQIHKPKYEDKDLTKLDTSKGAVWLAVPLDDMSTTDIEQLREDILITEAKIDTMVVVQYKDETDVQAQVDLIATPAFFFPSMGRA